MTVMFKNNIETTLGAETEAGNDVLAVFDETIFPDWNGEGWTPLFLIEPPVIDAAGNVVTEEQFEIVHAYHKFNNRIQVRRGAEGTATRAFPAGSIISARITQAAWESLLKSGTEVLTVLRGNNFGVDSGTANVIETVIADISGLSSHLQVNVLVNHDSTSDTVTLKVNNLPETEIALSDGTKPPVGSLRAGQEAYFRYSSVSNRFVLMNPDAKTLAAEGFSRASGTELAVGTTQNTKYVTPVGAFEIIENARNRPRVMSHQFQHLGDGKNNVFNSTGNHDYKAGFDHSHTDFTINGGHTVTATMNGVLVIRCTATATIEGKIVGPRGKQGSQKIGDNAATEDWIRIPFLGGRGGESASVAGRQIDPQESIYGPVSKGTTTQGNLIRAAMLSNAPMQHFQGGFGGMGVDNTTGNAQPMHPGGGIIIIAKDIVITGSAEFDVSGRPMNLVGAGRHAGASGGGCVLLLYQDSIQGEASARYYLGVDGDQSNNQELEMPSGHAEAGNFPDSKAGNGWMMALKIE